MEKDTFYTVEDIAEKLQVHPHTVRSYIHNGELKATVIGKGYKVRQSDFNEFVEKKYSE